MRHGVKYRMESILLLLDCVAIVLSVHWYVRNELRKPGAPVGGMLRYLQPPRTPAPPIKTRRQ